MTACCSEAAHQDVSDSTLLVRPTSAPPDRLRAKSELPSRCIVLQYTRVLYLVFQAIFKQPNYLHNVVVAFLPDRQRLVSSQDANSECRAGLLDRNVENRPKRCMSYKLIGLCRNIRRHHEP